MLGAWALLRGPSIAENAVSEVKSAWSSPRPEWDAAVGSLYTGAEQRGTDGALHAIEVSTGVNAKAGMLLAQLIRSTSPSQTLEVGCACGFSTLFLVRALVDVGGRSHISVDPYQHKMWHGVGIQKVIDAGLGAHHELMEDLSDLALPMLHKQGERFQLIFIDGDHRFDAIIADVRNSDRLLDPGAILVLDDTWMPSTRAAMSFIETNLAYQRVGVASNLAIYRKRANDQRKWQHFVPFPMTRPMGS